MIFHICMLLMMFHFTMFKTILHLHIIPAIVEIEIIRYTPHDGHLVVGCGDVVGQETYSARGFHWG